MSSVKQGLQYYFLCNSGVTSQLEQFCSFYG
jgi:hypothetical protein